MKTAHCYVCKKSKLKTEFYIDRSRPNGMSSKCKKCVYNRVHTPKEIKKRALYQRNLRKDPKQAKKLLARKMLTEAVRVGLLKRGSCAECKSSNRIHGHHFDYNKPLYIVWLCPKHHMAAHRGEMGHLNKKKSPPSKLIGNI